MATEYESRGGGGLGGCFSCCFGGGGGEELGEGARQRAARVVRTSSRWVRERVGELPELVARVGKRRQRQQAAGEFRYDAISYALNFEEDGGGEGGGEGEPFKYRAFSSRLPASPPPPPETAVATDRRS